MIGNSEGVTGPCEKLRIFDQRTQSLSPLMILVSENLLSSEAVP